MQHSCSHSNAICNHSFKNRIELRTQEQPLVAKHIGGTIRDRNDPSRTRRTDEVPFTLTFYLRFFLAFYLASILTFFLAFYLTYFLTSFLAFYLTFFLAFYLASILTFYLAFYLTYILTFCLAFWHSQLEPNWVQHGAIWACLDASWA